MQRPPRTQTTSTTNQSRRPSSRGFTLVELLAVIVIIAILISLIVPALGRATVTARETQVRADISALEAAIAAFQKDFNMAPPSRIILCEEASDWNSTNVDIVRSRNVLRQMWPQFSFAMDRDINRDGDVNGQYELLGAECLVFFLGGIARDANDPALTGFSKNPINPFAAPTGTDNRAAPYFEFNPARLLPSSNSEYSVFFAYVDPLPSQRTPYLYVSSYGGQGYRPADINPGSGLQDVYRSSAASTTSTLGQAWNATKYQIISPGYDQEFGAGGPFLPTQAVRFPGWTYTDSSGTVTVNPEDRQTERDNITNFHPSRLENN